MSEFQVANWSEILISDAISEIETGVSVNSENRRRGASEIGILKTSCISRGRFFPEEHKAILTDEVERAKTPLKARSILMSRMNTPNLVGEIGYVQHQHPGIYLPDRLWMFSGKEEISDTLFLSHLLSSDAFRQKLSDIATGTSGSMKNIPQRSFFQIPIQIPPLPEQKKIAEILSGIDKAISRTKFKVQKLDALQFSLTEEFTQDLQDNLEPSALEECAEVRTGVAKNSNSEGDMVEMPYMRVANVQDGYLDLSEIKSISIDRGRIERYLLQEGDVLINEGGDLDKVGRGVIWHEEVKQCLHQNHVFAVRCSEQLMPEFLSLFLKSSHSKNYFLGCAKQTTNLASINSTQLKSFPIPVPPLEEQKKFVEHIRSARDLSLAIAAEISALQAIKKAVSSDLLSGRKRVSV